MRLLPRWRRRMWRAWQPSTCRTTPVQAQQRRAGYCQTRKHAERCTCRRPDMWSGAHAVKIPLAACPGEECDHRRGHEGHPGPGRHAAGHGQPAAVQQAGRQRPGHRLQRAARRPPDLPGRRAHRLPGSSRSRAVVGGCGRGAVRATADMRGRTTRRQNPRAYWWDPLAHSRHSKSSGMLLGVCCAAQQPAKSYLLPPCVRFYMCVNACPCLVCESAKCHVVCVALASGRAVVITQHMHTETDTSRSLECATSQSTAPTQLSYTHLTLQRHKSSQHEAGIRGRLPQNLRIVQVGLLYLRASQPAHQR